MPKRTDIKTILVLGSGPIVIGQGCEFDYSGTQACKALKAEGYRIVLVNSNPATIMTDPAFSDRTYIEPITPEAVRKILKKEAELGPRIDAILPTLGGQTALNCACALFDNGTLKEFGVEMIGANREVIHRAEDRQAFKDICEGLGLKLPKAKTVKTLDDALGFLEQIGLPAIIRPAFTLGGTGGGIAYNREEFIDIVTRGLRASMIQQVQIDQSVIGWKEFELEVVRDKKDNCIIVCGIENIDPMGVHTGDSITVAPILTLTDKEYQAMRDAALAIMRAVGVETGGSNVQFAVNPAPTPRPDGTKPFEMVVVEMNPRVSRSSALASKATGFPIAKIAAKLAIGYTLDELRNDITGTTSACFEPTIDYVVTKMPRWTFEKFPEADETLTTQMKSVGEAMAIGRTLKESLQKVIRSMDVKRFGLGLDRNDKWLASVRAAEHGGRTADGQPVEWPIPLDKLERKLAVPSQGRLYYVRYALKMGWDIDRVHRVTRIDPFFLDQIQQLVQFEDVLLSYRKLEDVPADVFFQAKQLGYSDAQLANVYLGKITPETVLQVRAVRKGLGIEPVYKLVDTCAAEFEAVTPYYYSTYERGAATHAAADTTVTSSAFAGDDEIRVTDRSKVVIIGGGPNRIGQGIEFDYCCVHAAMAARQMGFESVMINSNPETVSTDYDTSDLLFFEPLTLEDTLNIIERLNGRPLTKGRIVDLSHIDGKTALNAERIAHDPADPTSAKFKGRSHVTLPADLFEQLERECEKRSIDRLAIVDASRWYQEKDGKEIEGATVSLVDPRGNVWLARFSSGHDPRLVALSLDPDPRWEQFFPNLHPRVCMAADAWMKSKGGLVHGTIVQFGGQTPLNLAGGLVKGGVPIIGTSLDSIDLAEDRDRFDALLEKLHIERPPAGIARSLDEAVEIAERLGYPVLLRPSYVLGGRGMEICSDRSALVNFMTKALRISDIEAAPVLIDKFLDGAVECDVDVVADFEPTGEANPGGHRRAIVTGLMEHIEHAGIHSGDSACTLPHNSLPDCTVERIRVMARDLARELRVCGLMNLQLAIKQDGDRQHIYVLEVNPRASRTVPFVSKATHIPWPSIAAKVMMGATLSELKATEPVMDRSYYAVKESVFPFGKFPGVDVVLGPEMRSTGEVMGIDRSLPIAFAKSQLAAGQVLPTDPKKGAVFVSVRAFDKPVIAEPVRLLMEMGFKVYATEGTAAALQKAGLKPEVLTKIAGGTRPNVLDMMANQQIALIINTPTRTGYGTDEGKIRSTAVRLNIPMITTATAGLAAAKAIQAMRAGDWDVAALQDYLAMSKARGLIVETVRRDAAARV
jgi:carbamoylphosphate synthase large subunit